MVSPKLLIITVLCFTLNFSLIGCKETSPSGVGDSSTSGNSSSGVSIESGDFILLGERAGGSSTIAMQDGSVIVISAAGEFKGTALARDVNQEILRYPRGLKIEKDPFDNEYTLAYGTTNTSLQMEVHQILPVFVPGQETQLTASALAPNTDSVASNTFAFGFTGQNKSSGKRFISDSVGGYPFIHSYMQGATGTTCYDYTVGGASYSGWYIGGMFTGIGAFGVTDLYVARYKSGQWAVDRFNSTCSSQTLELVSGTFGGSDVYVTDVNNFQSAGDDWDDDIFTTYRVGFGSPFITRYDASSAYAADASPFTASARAMFWQSDSGTGGNKIWTLEEDGSNYYIRRYDGSGNLEATVFTDAGKNIFYTSISAYMIRMPF